MQNLDLPGAIVVEIAITAFLVAAIFSFMDERNAFAPPKALFPLAVGIVVAVIGGSFGTLTGFAMIRHGILVRNCSRHWQGGGAWLCLDQTDIFSFRFWLLFSELCSEAVFTTI